MAEIKTIQDGLRAMGRLVVEREGSVGHEVAEALRAGADKIDQLERELACEKAYTLIYWNQLYGKKPSWLSRIMQRIANGQADIDQTQR